jgi:Rrf2 family protein
MLMFGLSQSVGYAIQALACLEAGSCETRFVRDIATCSKVPPAYLAKIFKKLGDAGILISRRGWAGGTSLSRPAREITLLEIALAIEGPELMANCLLGYDCNAEGCGCPTEKFWKRTRVAVEHELRRTTLADVIASRRNRAAKGNCLGTPKSACRLEAKKSPQSRRSQPGPVS